MESDLPGRQPDKPPTVIVHEGRMRDTREHKFTKKTHRPGASSAYANAAERTLDGEREPEPTRLNVTGKDTNVFLGADQERETKVERKQTFVKRR